jgi:uncharacterized protein
MIDSVFPHTYTAALDQLSARLAEPAPGRVQLLSGPRQVGKTTLLLDLARAWGRRAVYAAADVPEAALAGWWDALWAGAERLAGHDGAVLLIDEIPALPNWSRLLKAQFDRVLRHRTRLHVVVSGSSALQLGSGARETMAGRFERVRLLHWPAQELAARLGIPPDKAADHVVRFGGYPGGVSLLGDGARWRSYIRDSVMEPAIGKDVLMMETIRRPALLRQVFAVCVGHPAETVSLQKLCGLLSHPGAMETVAHYLHILEEACLVAAVRKYSGRTLRRRASPPKLIALNNALLAAGASPMSSEPDAAGWGRWVENACIALAWNAGQAVSYWRAEPLEVDLVTEGSWGQWAIEVKTGRYGHRDLAGLFEFCRLHRQFRPLVLCDEEDEGVARHAGVECRPWRTYLMEGLAGWKSGNLRPET